MKNLYKIIKGFFIIVLMCILLCGCKINKCVINFDTDGGTPKIEKQVINKGDKVSKPKVIVTKKGYKFISWQLNGKDYNFDSKVNSDITLKIKWEKSPVSGEKPKTFKVYFDTDGGIPTIDPIILKEGETVKKPIEKILKQGYTFIEWQLNGIAFDFNTKIKEDIKLKIHWKKDPVIPQIKKEFKITYNLNGGVNNSKNKKIITNQESFELLEPTKEDSIFLGWYLDSSLTKKIERIEVGLKNDLVLYAKFLEGAINVCNYGADKTGERDSTKSFIRALSKLRELENKYNNVTLYLEKGTYKITKEYAEEREVHTSNTSSMDFPIKKIGLLIEEHKNLEIEGNDSLILFEGAMMALGIFHSENIKIHNLSWDFLVPSTSEMTVFDYNKTNKTIDYFIPEYFKYKIEGTKIKWLSEKDSKGNYYWSEVNEHQNYGISIKYPHELMGRSYYNNIGILNSRNISKIDKLPNGLLRIHYNNLPLVEPIKGMNIQFVSNAVRPTAGSMIWESKDVELKRVKISYMHGFGFLVQMAENVCFDEINMDNDYRTGKNTSSYADGIHVSGAKGKIIIKNSHFNNTHDDPINIHGTFTRVEKMLDKHTLKLKYIHKQQGGFRQFHIGDKVLFYTRDTLESKDNEKEYTVKNVIGPTKNDLRTMTVEFYEELPSFLKEKIGNSLTGEPKFVCENITYTPEVYIKNNKFKNVFTRMILVTTRKKVIIEDNYFDASSMPQIFLSNDSDEWYESGPIRDITIRNNTFNVRTLGRTWWKYSPAIYIHPVTKGASFPSYENPIHKNILIEDNTFYLESDGVIRAESVESLTFRNNKIIRLNPDIKLKIDIKEPILIENETAIINLDKEANVVINKISLPGGPENNSGTVANLFEFMQSKNILIENNTYDNGLKKYVLIEGMPAHTINLKDSEIKIIENRNIKTNPDDPIKDIIFVSTNPNSLLITNEGKIKALKEGKSYVYAYTIWDGKIIRSNKILVKIEKGTLKEKLYLDNYCFNVNENTSTLNLTSNNVKIDYNLKSLNPEIIEIENNKLKVIKTGYAKLLVISNNKETEILLFVNNTQDQFELNKEINIEQKDENIELFKDGFKIKRISGQDLWQNNNTLKNLVTIDLSKYNLNNLGIIATIEGLPYRESSNSWDSSYIILSKNNNGYLDRDNYISVGKRAHADGFATCHETNGRCIEQSNNEVSKNNINEATFCITKVNNEIKLYYLDDKNNLVHIQTFDNTLGDNLILGFGCWGDTQSNNITKFKNIKIGTSDIDTLKKQAIKTILVPIKDEYKLNDYKFDLEKDEIKIIQNDFNGTNYFIAEKDGVLYSTTKNTIKLSEPGVYNIYLVTKVNNIKYSKVVKEKIEIKENLEKTYIFNYEIKDNINLIIPNELEEINVYEKGNYKTININGINELNLNGKKITLIKKDIDNIKIEKIIINNKEQDINKKYSFILTEDKSNTIKFIVKTTSDTNNLLATNQDHLNNYKVVKIDNSKYEVTIDLYNGINSIKLTAYSKDKKTKYIHTIHILRITKFEKGIKKVEIENKEIDLSNKEITISSFNKNSKINIIPNDINAKATYLIEETKDNNFLLRIKILHEDFRTKEYYSIIIKKS